MVRIKPWNRLLVLVAVVYAAQSGCAVPRHIWKQDDVQALTLNEGGAGKGVLIASGRSDFKQAVIERLETRLEPKGVPMRIAGLSALENERADAFDAVVVMSSCVAWGLDPRVDSFLKHNVGAANVVVLATSGGGDWLPDTKGKAYDAVSSASKQTRVDEVASEIAEKLDAILGEN